MVRTGPRGVWYAPMRTLAFALLVSACGTSNPATTDDGPDAGPATGGGSTADAAAGQLVPRMPAPTGTCPAITRGDVTFAPAGMPPRKVKLELDPAVTAPGELVLYWHATYSGPLEAAYSLGDTQAAITARGGVIATPYSDATAGTFEWFIVNQSPKLDDFRLADEIVACLHAAGRIEPTRIHSMGMSAGALQTTALSFLRSSYIASVATFSGGMPDGVVLPSEEPANKFAALIFDGGASDTVFGVDFQAASVRYRETLAAGGHFAARCNHGNGHEIPRDAAPSVAMFFADHPFGAAPSPYADGLPASFPSYCVQ